MSRYVGAGKIRGFRFDVARAHIKDLYVTVCVQGVMGVKRCVRCGKGSHGDAAKTVEVLEGVSTLEALLPFIKDLYVTVRGCC